jgi:ATP-binding cassette subfamily F protein uup
VGDGYDTVQIGGVPRNIIGYLQDFLFTPERARTPVKFLSGGERNRVLLARLFAKPANLIVLDEPTNDLDAETLELLEERLAEFAGTVLLVSHDRAFLNNVVTSTIVFEPADEATREGRGGQASLVKEYVGGYDDGLRQRGPALARGEAAAAKRPAPPSAAPAVEPAAKKRKLSFKEQQELAGLPGLIETLEREIAEVHAAMATPDYYRQAGDVLAREQARLQEAERRLAEAFARWEALDAPAA